MFLNTDINDYLGTYLANGIPASSVRVTELPSDYNPYIKREYPASYEKFLLNEKLRILYKNPSRYHQSRLSEWDCQFFLNGHENMLEACMKTPYDLVICKKQDSGEYAIDFVHLVFPNGWGADDAIGKPFSYFHRDVSRSDGSKIVPDSNKFAEHFAMSGKIYERVGAMSFRSSSRLDRHPRDMDETEFYHGCDGVFVRFERQVIASVPEKEAFMFLIQTHHVDVRAKPHLILNAISNRSPDSHTTRVLEHHDDREFIINYINFYLRAHYGS